MQPRLTGRRPTDEQRAVLAWGRAHRRDLPWRRTRDPWAVLVSEVMLQQTQVARVVDRYREFLEVYPTPAAMARRPLGEVLRRWQGLGYPRRARNLHAAARRCVELHDGAVPDRLDDLLALPGVGGYTARAVLAFAFEQDVGVVDTNIARILARRGATTLTPSAAQRSADDWVPAGRSWEWNQTVMDLGAGHCRPEPRCDACPIGCAWRDAGHPVPDPAAGSAHVSRAQGRFAGSDRQARGRLLAALGAAPLADDPSTLASVMQLGDDHERAARLADALVVEGLVERGAGTLRLP